MPRRPTDPTPPAGVSVPGAARYLGVSESAVRGYADTGRIPSWRDHVGSRLFAVQDLEAFAAARLARKVK